MKLKFYCQVLLAVLFSSVGHAEGHLEKVRRLRPLLANLARLQVRVYRHQDWCQCLQYRRGAFMSSSHETTCGLFQAKALPFDAVARRDFARLDRWRDGCGVSFHYVLAEVSGSRIRQAEFALSGFDRQSYVYDPGYKLPRNEGTKVLYQRIDRDFYLRTEDW